MDRQDLFNDLEFQDQYIVEQKVQPKGFFEDVPFVFDRHEQSRRTGIDLRSHSRRKRLL